MQMSEPARTGWAEVLTAEHPPTELRLEAIEAGPPRTPRRDTPRAATRLETPRPEPPATKRPAPWIPEAQQAPVPQRPLRAAQPEPRPAVFPAEKDGPPSRVQDLWVPPWHYGPEARPRRRCLSTSTTRTCRTEVGRSRGNSLRLMQLTEPARRCHRLQPLPGPAAPFRRRHRPALTAPLHQPFSTSCCCETTGV